MRVSSSKGNKFEKYQAQNDIKFERFQVRKTSSSKGIKFKQYQVQTVSSLSNVKLERLKVRKVQQVWSLKGINWVQIQKV